MAKYKGSLSKNNKTKTKECTYVPRCKGSLLVQVQEHTPELFGFVEKLWDLLVGNAQEIVEGTSLGSKEKGAK